MKLAEGSACIPNLASRNGCRGHASRRRKMSCDNSGQRTANGSITLRHATPSSPNAACASSKFRSNRIAVPSSIGCASGVGEWIHSRPEKNGDPAAIGCIAEPKSWWKPGSVSSMVRAAPRGAIRLRRLPPPARPAPARWLLPNR